MIARVYSKRDVFGGKISGAATAQQVLFVDDNMMKPLSQQLAENLLQILYIYFNLLKKDSVYKAFRRVTNCNKLPERGEKLIVCYNLLQVVTDDARKVFVTNCNRIALFFNLLQNKILYISYLSDFVTNFLRFSSLPKESPSFFKGIILWK